MSTEKIPVLNIVFPRYKASQHLSYDRMEDQSLTISDIKDELFSSSLKSYKDSVNRLTIDDCLFEEEYHDVTLEDEVRGQ